MRLKTAILVLLLSGGGLSVPVLLTGCGGEPAPETGPASPPPMPGHEGHGGTAGASQGVPAEKGKVLYHCPMHPAYISDKPGDCPICNMKLVPMESDAGASASTATGYAEVKITPERQQLIGVRTGRVEKGPVSRTIRAAGRVGADETRLSTVNLKFGGWVEELFVGSVGQVVKKGDPLFLIYSPELLEAENSYLIAFRANRKPGPGTGDFPQQDLRSARERLLNWDITPEQITELEAREMPENRVKILSRVEGVVTRRDVVKGGYAEPMKDLYGIADLSSVWVEASVYEYEMREVKVGLKATIHAASLPGGFIAGEVGYVYPFLDEESRSVRVRIEVPNPDGRLKPGMFAEVAITVDLGEALTVDDTAVMDTGIRQIVFVVRDDAWFEPREVKAGPHADGRVVILSGLMAGEKVVVSGNFLIDSESRLKAAMLSGMAGGGHKH